MQTYRPFDATQTFDEVSSLTFWFRNGTAITMAYYSLSRIDFGPANDDSQQLTLFYHDLIVTIRGWYLRELHDALRIRTAKDVFEADRAAVFDLRDTPGYGVVESITPIAKKN